MKNSKKPATPPLPTSRNGVEEAIRKFYVEKNFSCDYLIIGDGSGTLMSKHSGWTCVVYERMFDQAKILYGLSNLGTNNFAELSTYIHGLSYLMPEPKLLPVKPGCRKTVEIVTDSEITAKGGNKEYARGANQLLWSIIEFAETNAFKIHWNWVPRNSNPVSCFCDALAGSFRKEMIESEEKWLTS